MINTGRIRAVTGSNHVAFGVVGGADQRTAFHDGESHSEIYF